MTIIPCSMIVMSSPPALKQADRVSLRTGSNCKRCLVVRNDRNWTSLRQRVENSIGAVVKSQNSELDLN
jgi:hypothetical protein